MLFKETGNFHKDFFTIDLPDINLIQKILLCFLFMSVLDSYENSDFPILKKKQQKPALLFILFIPGRSI